MTEERDKYYDELGKYYDVKVEQDPDEPSLLHITLTPHKRINITFKLPANQEDE